MTEREKLAYKVLDTTNRHETLEMSACRACKRSSYSWDEYPSHVLMEILVDPQRLDTTGCSMWEERDD